MSFRLSSAAFLITWAANLGAAMFTTTSTSRLGPRDL
jgi:hypothetical protein